LVRAVKGLLSVTSKLKQLWTLSETKEDNVDRKTDVDSRLAVNDVAGEISSYGTGRLILMRGEKMNEALPTKLDNDNDEET